MDRLNVGDFQKMFLAASALIIKREPYLTEIDSIIGDGDHGTGMKTGFLAVAELLKVRSYEYVDDLCYGVSTELIKTMGGASGVIFGTMFLGGLSRLPHETDTNAAELAAYFREGERAVERRGRSTPGQKTMLDALYPACMAMEETAKRTEDIPSLFAAAFEGAKQGVEQCKCLQSRRGRSRNFREKTVGLPDPGAVSTCFLFQAFAECLMSREAVIDAAERR